MPTHACFPPLVASHCPIIMGICLLDIHLDSSHYERQTSSLSVPNAPGGAGLGFPSGAISCCAELATVGSLVKTSWESPPWAEGCFPFCGFWVMFLNQKLRADWEKNWGGLLLNSRQAYHTVCLTAKFLPHDSDMFVPKHVHFPKRKEPEREKISELKYCKDGNCNRRHYLIW